MGAACTRTDYEWSEKDEPHAGRRKEILSKHPEIKTLMVVDHTFKYVVTLMVLFQFFMAYVVSHFQFSWPVVVLLTYVVSGTVNHALLLAVHEIAHNQAYGTSRPRSNKIFGLFVNLPVGVPFAISFKTYHLEHHKYQGHELIDADIPTEFEAKLFTNTIGKAIWMFFQPLFYAFRPLYMNPRVATSLEILNFAMVFVVDVIVYYYLGGKSLFYLILGSLLGMGLHPVAGHFISEHYMFSNEHETYSYYGPLNKVTFNVGYHNEHHDFPSVPGKLLPKVREFAPEYYENLPSHSSWVKVLYDYITDPSVGPYARTKRREYLYQSKEANSKSS